MLLSIYIISFTLVKRLLYVPTESKNLNVLQQWRKWDYWSSKGKSSSNTSAKVVKVINVAEEPSGDSAGPTLEVHRKRKKDTHSLPSVTEGSSGESHSGSETNSIVRGMVSNFPTYYVYFCRFLCFLAKKTFIANTSFLIFFNPTQNNKLKFWIS